MVSALIFVLIAAVLTVVATLVIKIGEIGVGSPGPAVPVTAETIAVPPGQEIVAIGEGRGSIMVVTRDASGRERILTFDRATGAPLSETAVTRE